MPSEELSVLRIERQIDSIERQVKEMRHSLKVFVSNPRKYEPQLENLASAAVTTMSSARGILRSLGIED